MPSPPPRAPSNPRLLSTSLWFFLLVASVCAWILLLPLFPTQDGPMHRYYVHVLHSLLEHQPAYDVYRIRHPLPPYLTHYATLLVLFHLLPYDFAVKLFACLLVLCLAYGLRASARQAGPMGEWAALLVAPLLLAWPLMMGFFNFFLGLGLFLFCTAYWQRMRKGEVWAMLPFLVLLALLMVTHPIPLLLLIVVCAMDLAGALVAAWGRPAAAPLRLLWLPAACFVLVLVAAAFPAMAVDSSKTHGAVAMIGFHADYLRTSLLLAGISPYNTRSPRFWINVYRVVLYAILLWALWAGGRAFFSRRDRLRGFGGIMWVATVVLLVVLPFTPNKVNGSEFFTTRLVYVLWLGALLGASAADAPGPRAQRGWILAGWLGCLLTLIPAQIYIRPLARQLHEAELQPLPAHVPGVLLLSPGTDAYVRFHEQLAFDPYKWGAILAVIHANDVALDSPWMDQTITPIEAAPGGPELIADISYAGMLEPPSPNAPAAPGRSLPAWGEVAMVHDAGFMLLSGPPETLTHGLSTQLSPGEAAMFACQPPHGWYLLCLRRQAAPGTGG